MNQINLIKKSSSELEYTMSNVPDGITVTKAFYQIKESYSDDDALLEKEIITSQTADGWITDDGADGKAVLKFTIDNDDLDDVAPGLYVCSVKVVLNNGLSCESLDSRDVVKIHQEGIEDVV